MAKTYKELAAELAARGMTDTMDKASSVVDAVVFAPANAARAVKNIKETMTSKAEVVATAIEAKLLLEDKLLGDIDDAEFAYQLAGDENLRKTMNQLTQQILQPTPVESLASDKSNSFVNIGAGLSAYWQEMQKKLPIEIATAAEVENILMNVNAGLDADLEPDTRKLFLKEAGMNREQVNELVPISAYAAYEDKLKDAVRSEVMGELGLDGSRELTEQEELLVESFAEDRMMNSKIILDEDPALGNYEPTYGDTYGISAQDMYTMFGEMDDGQPVPDPETWTDAPADDPEWQHIMELSGAEENYWDMMNDTVENNMDLLHELEANERAAASDIGLTDADLAFADMPAPDYDDDFMRGISEADLAFADENGYEQY